jgi:CheY-like chemotaxis protein
MYSKLKRPLTILIAEDDPDDRFLIQEAMSSLNIFDKIVFVEHGQELMDFLRHCGQYQGQTVVPDMLMIDLNLPVKTGFEAIREIKSSKNLRRIPIVVLTVSDRKDAINAAYDLGVSGYITKTNSSEQFSAIMRQFARYWFETVFLPTDILVET